MKKLAIKDIKLKNPQMSIHVQGHKSDFVHTVIGLNKPTGGSNSEGTSTLGEWKNMFGNPATVHSCYGVGNDGCYQKNYWKDGIQNSQEKFIPVWVPIYKNNQPAGSQRNEKED